MSGPAFDVLAMTDFIRAVCLFQIVALIMLPTAALAQIVTKIELKSDDRFRGRSLSNTSPIAKIDVAVDLKGGAYFGGSVVANLGGVESVALQRVNGYFGYAIPIDNNVTIDIGMTGYSYTSAYSGKTATGYGEVYLGISSGKVAIYTHHTPDYFGKGIAVIYTSFNYASLLDNDITLHAQAGILMQTSGIPRLGGRDRRYDARVAFSKEVLGWETEIGLTIGGPNDNYFAGPWGGSSALTVGIAKHF